MAARTDRGSGINCIAILQLSRVFRYDLDHILGGNPWLYGYFPHSRRAMIWQICSLRWAQDGDNTRLKKASADDILIVQKDTILSNGSFPCGSLLPVDRDKENSHDALPF